MLDQILDDLSLSTGKSKDHASAAGARPRPSPHSKADRRPKKAYPLSSSNGEPASVAEDADFETGVTKVLELHPQRKFQQAVVPRVVIIGRPATLRDARHDRPQERTFMFFGSNVGFAS